jgi:glycosyltransferase involved in cell wall biosynthesis
VKVGLAVHDVKGEAGGGYTFSTELYDAIARRSQSVPEHDFVAFGNTREAPAFVDQSPLPYVSLYRSKKERISRRFDLLKDQMRRPSAQRPTESGQQTFANAQLHAAGIQFVINLWPELCLTKEVPYLSIVWDLQHRLQPFFPEVSGDGVWKHRENLLTELLQRASYVVVGNGRGRSEVEQFYGVDGARIRQLPHPTPAFALGAAETALHSLPASLDLPPNFLLYPAQFWPHKNHMQVLRALALLRKRDKLCASVVFCGTDAGNQEHVKEHVGQLGLSEQVVFLNFVERETLVLLYRHARALIYPTLFGPENLPPLEAFALSCPVIASAVPGAAEQLGDAALLVDPLDVEDVAAAIKQVMKKDDLCRTLISRGKKRALSWTVDDFAVGLFDILEEFVQFRRCWR